MSNTKYKTDRNQSLVEKLIKNTDEYWRFCKKENSRYLSWEHCHIAFCEARNKKNLTESDKDQLCLHLAFYLASWGMYRGSSFLLQQDYKIHRKVVDAILDSDKRLQGAGCVELANSELNQALWDLSGEITKYYSDVRNSVSDLLCKKEVDSDLSTILITKVLLGTLGCVPAYDQYFAKGVAYEGVTTKTYNKASLDNLIEFYKNNFDQLETYRKTLQKENLEYTQMKLLDMAFWQIGFTSIKLELHDERNRIDEEAIIQRKNNELTFENSVNRFIDERELDRNHLIQEWPQNKNKIILTKTIGPGSKEGKPF